MLDDEERARAQRFVHRRDSQRFIAGRAGLRSVIGRYAGIAPASLSLELDEYGKPSMQGGPHFNLSHSGSDAMLAVSACFPVGIDIETIRPLKEDIAAHYFSERERRALAALPADRQLQAFYKVWTRKEAFVKAIGLGLSFPLDAFDVTVDGAVPAIERLEQGGGQAGDWRLFDLEVLPPLAGSLAVFAEGRPVTLRYRHEEVLRSAGHPEYSD
jgi:4'-phosphopantetheinyl transferase